MKSLSDPVVGGDGSCRPDEKQCRKCGQCFPAIPEYFSRDKNGQMGLHYWCKACTQAHGRRYKKQNPKRVKEYNQRWDEENPDYMRE